MSITTRIHHALATLGAGLASVLACAAVGTTVCTMTGTAARAQCPPEGWLPGEGYCGADGSVYAMTMWDPDGDGPMTPRVIVGGSFTSICNVAAMNVAMYDPDTDTWSAMGAGLGSAANRNEIRDFAVQPNGRLIAVGQVSSNGTVGVGIVARWTGTQWLQVGSDFTGVNNWPSVRCIAALANGDLIVGGSFTTAGGVPASAVARWNGDVWSGLGTGTSPGVGGVNYPQVHDIEVVTNGDVIVGGQFLTAGGSPANYIARWNGVTWSAMGSGVGGWKVDRLQHMPDGSLVVLGSFESAGGVAAVNVARWNQGTWSAFPGGPIQRSGETAKLLANGDLLVGGAGGYVRWSDGNWVLNEETEGTVYAFVELPNGDLMAGGTLTNIGTSGVKGVARQTGTTWRPLCHGINGEIYDMKPLPNGDIIVAGKFSHIGNIDARRIARWDGNQWHPIGTGVDQRATYVSSVAPMPNGDIVISGSFWSVGGVSATFLARWDGETWSPIGNALGHGRLAALPNGNFVSTNVYVPNAPIYINGIARWDGQAWNGIPSSFGPTGQGAQWGIGAIAALPNGDILLGGGFGTAPNGAVVNGIARWNGTTWLPIGDGLGGSGQGGGSVLAILPLPDGRIVVGGQFYFSTASGLLRSVAIWNGTTWLPMGTGVTGSSQSEGIIQSLARLPSGDIVAAGDFVVPGAPECRGIARWNGSAWLPMEAGLGNCRYFDDGHVLCLDRNGNLLVGGSFDTAGPQISANLARYAAATPRCVADLDNGSSTGVHDCAVTIDDLLFFLTAFEAGDIAVDLDNGTFTGVRDGAVTIDDLLFFLVRFEEGC